MLTPEPFISHIISHIFTALFFGTVITVFLPITFRCEIFTAHLAPLCVLREQFRREIFVKRKHRAEKVIAVDVVLTDELYAHIVHQNTFIIYAITTLTPYKLVNLSSLLII